METNPSAKMSCFVGSLFKGMLEERKLHLYRVFLFILLRREDTEDVRLR